VQHRHFVVRHRARELVLRPRAPVPGGQFAQISDCVVQTRLRGLVRGGRESVPGRRSAQHSCSFAQHSENAAGAERNAAQHRAVLAQHGLRKPGRRRPAAVSEDGDAQRLVGFAHPAVCVPVAENWKSLTLHDLPPPLPRPPEREAHRPRHFERQPLRPFDDFEPGAGEQLFEADRVGFLRFQAVEVGVDQAAGSSGMLADQGEGGRLDSCGSMPRWSAMLLASVPGPPPGSRSPS
jgi:hypothetical protein